MEKMFGQNIRDPEVQYRLYTLQGRRGPDGLSSSFGEVIVVTFGLDDLRRQVFGSAAQRPGAIRQLLGEAKVRDLQVAVAIQQQVLRLQIPVHHVLSVQVVQRAHDLRRVEIT